MLLPSPIITFFMSLVPDTVTHRIVVHLPQLECGILDTSVLFNT